MRVVMLCAILTAFASARVEAAPAPVEHGDNFQLPKGDARLPDHMGEAVRWFDENL